MVTEPTLFTVPSILLQLTRVFPPATWGLLVSTACTITGLSFSSRWQFNVLFYTKLQHANRKQSRDAEVKAKSCGHTGNTHSQEKVQSVHFPHVCSDQRQSWWICFLATHSGFVAWLLMDATCPFAKVFALEHWWTPRPTTLPFVQAFEAAARVRGSVEGRSCSQLAP